MRKGFDAGVVAGGIRNSYEVNILICYILKTHLYNHFSKEKMIIDKATEEVDRKSASLSYNQLAEILLKECLVNYFEFTNSLAELKDLSQVDYFQKNDEKYYYITKKGELNLDILELELPKTIRERMVLKVSNINAQKKRLEKNRSTIKKVDDGYILILEILDIGSNLLTTELFVADKFSAKAMEKKFLNNPKLLFQAVLSTLTGDVDSLKKIADSSVEEIF